MKCRGEEIKSAAERAAAIMKTHESATRKREEEERTGGKEGSEGVRERQEDGDFSSVTVAFHLTASLPPCQHTKKKPQRRLLERFSAAGL